MDHCGSPLVLKCVSVILSLLQVCATIRSYNPQHLANIAHAYSKVSVHHAVLFDRIAEMTRRSIQGFRSQELANLAMAFARLDIRHKGLLVSLADEVLYRGTVGVSFGKRFHFDLLSIQQLTSAFARLGLHDPRLFFVLARLSKEGLRRALVYGQLPDVAAGSAAEQQGQQPKKSKQTQQTQAKRHTERNKSDAILRGETEHRREDRKKKSPYMSTKWRREFEAAKGQYRLDGQVLASLTHALGRAKVPVGDAQSLHGVLARAILKLEKNFSALSLAQLSAGCHLLGLRDGRVSRALLRQAAARASQFPPGALVLLLTSFGNLGLYNAGFTREAVRMARLYLASYTAPELAAVVVALENLHFRHEAFLEKTARALVARRYDLSPRSLCGVLGAFAKLGVEDDKLYDVLFDEVFANQHKLSQSNALSALYALVLVDSRAEDRAVRTLGHLSGASAVIDCDGEGPYKSLKDSSLSSTMHITVEQQLEASDPAARTEEEAIQISGPDTSRIPEESIPDASVQPRHELCLDAKEKRDLHDPCPTSSPSVPCFLSKAAPPRNWMQERFGLLQALLYAAFRDQKRLLVGSVSRLQLIDLYLRLFRPRVFASIPFELKAFLARVRSVDLAEADCFALSSRMHKHVSSAFLRVGIFHRSEVQLGPFSLDLVVGDRLAVEVDGPSHFYRETCMRTASSRLKQKLVRAMGWKLLKVSYLEWQQLVTPERKLAYAAAFWKPVLASHYAKAAARRASEVAVSAGVPRRKLGAWTGTVDGEQVVEGKNRRFVCAELETRQSSVEKEREKGRQAEEVSSREGEEANGQIPKLDTRPTLQDLLWLLEEQGGDALVTRSRLVRAMERYRKLFLFPSPGARALAGSVEGVTVSRLLPPGARSEPEVWKAMKGRPVAKLLPSHQGCVSPQGQRGRSIEHRPKDEDRRSREKESPSADTVLLSGRGSRKDARMQGRDSKQLRTDTADRERVVTSGLPLGQRFASRINGDNEMDASCVYYLACNRHPTVPKGCEDSVNGEAEELGEEQNNRRGAGSVAKLVPARRVSKTW